MTTTGAESGWLLQIVEIDIHDQIIDDSSPNILYFVDYADMKKLEFWNVPFA
jgi:hypothetical protein